MINVLRFTPLFAESRTVYVCVRKTREPPSSIKGSRRRRADWYKSETYDDRERDKGNLDASPGHDCRLLPLLPDPDPSRSIPFRIVPRHSVGITFRRCEPKRYFARDRIVADCDCRHIDFHAKKTLSSELLVTTSINQISATRAYGFARCVESKMSLLQTCAPFYRSVWNSIRQVTKLSAWHCISYMMWHRYACRIKIIVNKTLDRNLWLK